DVLHRLVEAPHDPAGRFVLRPGVRPERLRGPRRRPAAGRHYTPTRHGSEARYADAVEWTRKHLGRKRS
ncbi:hypothetical protein ACWDRX_24105, partial [Streptomyces nigra]